MRRRRVDIPLTPELRDLAWTSSRPTVPGEETIHDDTLADLIDEVDGWEKDVQERIKRGSYGYDGGEERWNDDHAEWATNHGIVTALRELQRLRAVTSGPIAPPPAPGGDV